MWQFSLLYSHYFLFYHFSFCVNNTTRIKIMFSPLQFLFFLPLKIKSEKYVHTLRFKQASKRQFFWLSMIFLRWRWWYLDTPPPSYISIPQDREIKREMVWIWWKRCTLIFSHKYKTRGMIKQRLETDTTNPHTINKKKQYR